MSDLSTSSAPPASVKPQPPAHDPPLERLRALVRGMAVDLAVVAAVVAPAASCKTVSGDRGDRGGGGARRHGAVHKGH